jgi:hypothetical protein
MTGDLNSIDLVFAPGQRRGIDEAETKFRFAQWTGTATSSPASASGTTIGLGRR